VIKLAEFNSDLDIKFLSLLKKRKGESISILKPIEVKISYSF